MTVAVQCLALNALALRFPNSYV